MKRRELTPRSAPRLMQHTRNRDGRQVRMTIDRWGMRLCFFAGSGAVKGFDDAKDVWMLAAFPSPPGRPERTGDLARLGASLNILGAPETALSQVISPNDRSPAEPLYYAWSDHGPLSAEQIKAIRDTLLDRERKTERTATRL